MKIFLIDVVAFLIADMIYDFLHNHIQIKIVRADNRSQEKDQTPDTDR